jgi:YgiT-type zinc finger domain-containing protein
MTKLKITKCPTCGSKRIRRVRRDIKGSFRGKPYIARNVEFEECPNCGERLFDLEAMAKLETARTVPTRRTKRVA